MNRYIFILALAFLTITLIDCACAESFGTYKVNTNVNLVFSCQNSTYLNISNIYLYPSSNYTISRETITTKNGNVYNYTVPSQNLSQVGTYVVNYHCDINAIDTPSVSSFTVDNGGYSVSTADSIIFIIAFVAIGLIAILLFLFGVKSANVPVKIFTLALAVMFIIFAIGFGYNAFNIILGKYSALSNTFSSFYTLTIVMLTVGGMGIIVWLIYFATTMWWKHRGIID